MSGPMFTRQEAGALADLIRAIRPSWDAYATFNAIAELNGRPLADVARATILTAQDPTCRTPKALTFTDNDHWRSMTADARYVPPRRREACPTHANGYRGHCGGCEADRKAQTGDAA